MKYDNDFNKLYHKKMQKKIDYEPLILLWGLIAIIALFFVIIFTCSHAHAGEPGVGLKWDRQANGENINGYYIYIYEMIPSEDFPWNDPAQLINIVEIRKINIGKVYRVYYSGLELKPDMIYRFVVTGFNRFGESDKSNAVWIDTRIEPVKINEEIGNN